MSAPKPMLLHTAKGRPPQVPSGDGWILEPKLDGWRFLAEVGENGVDLYAGRNGAGRAGEAPAIAEALAFLPAGTILDGELLVPGGEAAQVSSALAGARLPLRFVAFDVLAVAGTDIRGWPWTERRALLDKIAEGFDGELVAISEVLPATQAEFERLLDAGFEGAVAKRTASKYLDGKRSHDWLKLKPQSSAEAVITGFVAGKGKYAGTVGALTFRMLDSGAESSCAVYPAMVEQMAADPDAWSVGRTIEIWHMGMFGGKVPRHPIFHRLRPDRDAHTIPQEV